MTALEERPEVADLGLHRQLGLTDEELDAIRSRLGRDPNDLELAMFSVMWSEHCSYKSSRPLLRTLPTSGAGVLAGPGANAGVISIGLLDERVLTRAVAPGPGNLVVLFGSTTGRDGIGGASVLASATFLDGDSSKRPSVQVGDPFAEKLLIEASLELIVHGLIEGLQDLGAGGVTCATSETAERAGTGIHVDLDAMPRREPDSAPVAGLLPD